MNAKLIKSTIAAAALLTLASAAHAGTVSSAQAAGAGVVLGVDVLNNTAAVNAQLPGTVSISGANGTISATLPTGGPVSKSITTTPTGGATLQLGTSAGVATTSRGATAGPANAQVLSTDISTTGKTGTVTVDTNPLLNKTISTQAQGSVKAISGTITGSASIGANSATATGSIQNGNFGVSTSQTQFTGTIVSPLIDAVVQVTPSINIGLKTGLLSTTTTMNFNNNGLYAQGTLNNFSNVSLNLSGALVQKQLDLITGAVSILGPDLSTDGLTVDLSSLLGLNPGANTGLGGLTNRPILNTKLNAVDDLLYALGLELIFNEQSMPCATGSATCTAETNAIHLRSLDGGLAETLGLVNLDLKLGHSYVTSAGWMADNNGGGNNVPEPASLSLFALAALGAAGTRRRAFGSRERVCRRICRSRRDGRGPDRV